MTGGTLADLTVGDRLGPVEYVLTPLAVTAYCEANGMAVPSAPSPTGARHDVMPLTFLHVAKVRLLESACPAPTQGRRMHAEFDATPWAVAAVGTTLIISGQVVERKERDNNTFLVIAIEVRDAATTDLVATARDTTVISTVAA